jgi:hypothetical protein
MTRAIRRRPRTLAVALLATSALLAACGSSSAASVLVPPAPSPTNTATLAPIIAVTIPPTATAAPQPTYLHLETTPPGAQVEVGLQLVNNIVTPGTGRIVGVTPITIALRPSDISQLNATVSDIYWMTQLPGYIPWAGSIGLDTGASLEPGKTYSFQDTLAPIH